jgi:hypothetical protein
MLLLLKLLLLAKVPSVSLTTLRPPVNDSTSDPSSNVPASPILTLAIDDDVADDALDDESR